MRAIRTALVLIGFALAVVPAAWGHVTLNPREAAAGSFSEFLVRVPNEREDANTTKIDLKLPDGFVSASYAPIPGWTVEVKKKQLATPVETDDGPVSEEISEIIWTGDGQTGKIAPGEFLDFPLSVQVPGNAGDTLVFPALQTYDNGEVVSWIGDESAEEPAPRVLVTAATAEGAASVAAASDDSSDRDWLAIGLGAAALGIAVVALSLARKKRTT